MPACLVVEDSPVIREVAARRLEALGFEVRRIGGSTDAIAAIDATAPDLVLLDWELPALGALEVLNALAGAGAATPGEDILSQDGPGDHRPGPARPRVLLTLVENDPQQRDLGARAGADGWLVKPFDGSDLARALAGLGLGPAGRAKPDLRVAEGGRA